MELRQLTTFVRVAQFMSFSRAAESLGYSQSAVTVQIRQLEEELGTRLFDRMGKHILLTGPGEEFLQHAYEVLGQVNQARRAVASGGELQGRLRLGTIDSLSFAKLPAVLRLFVQQHPKATVHITTGEPEQLIQWMEQGLLDLVYLLDEPQYSNRWIKLLERREDVVFVASPTLGAELAARRELRVEDLLGLPFFLTEQDANYRRVLDRFLAARGVVLTPALETSDTSLLIRMLRVSRGVGFLPWYAVEREVRRGLLALLPVSDLHTVLYRQVFCHKEKWFTREMEEFLRLLKDAAS